MCKKSQSSIATKNIPATRNRLVSFERKEIDCQIENNCIQRGFSIVKKLRSCDEWMSASEG